MKCSTVIVAVFLLSQISAYGQEFSYETPVFTVGSIDARPGQSDLSLPLSISFEEGHLAGWTAVVQYDPSTLVATSIESALDADFVMVVLPYEFVEAGWIGVSTIYTIFGGSPLLPAQSGIVANVRLCVLTSSAVGDYTVTLEDQATLKAGNGTHTDAWYTRYGLQFDGVDYSELPVIVPGEVSVSGEPIPGGTCQDVEPPPAPQVSFQIEAPESVGIGQPFSAQFQVSSDTELVGLVAALDYDADILDLGSIEVNSQWDGPQSYIYANSTSVTGEVGIAVIPDMLSWEDRIPIGTSEIASLEFQVKPEATATTTAIRFVERIEQWVETDWGELSKVIITNGVGIDADGPMVPTTLDELIPVTTSDGMLALVAAPRFLRGDSNATGKIDTSDAVSTLQFLFMGGPEPICLDAADADDSGVLDITDPVSTLSYLFLGGREPSAPGPASPGIDPTPDALGCGVD